MTPLRYASPHRPLFLAHHKQPHLLTPPSWTRRAVLAAGAVASRSSGSNSTATRERQLEDRIREHLLTGGLPWVAMVPSPAGSRRASRSPRWVEWILQNQRADGSWEPAGGGSGDASSVAANALSSTMAGVDELVRKGLRFIDYLDTLIISKFGSSVPTTMYPRSMYSQLRMVDTLEKMGLSPSFSSEINNILDMIYRSWLAKDEDIMLDIATCAMAFRLLRLHGYDVPSDGLAQFSEESSSHDSVQGHLNDTEALLELYKASQVQIHEKEVILENIGSWTAKLLKQQLCSGKISRSVDPAEVEHVLKFPFYTTLDRLEHRRNIEHFKPAGGFQMLKSGYRAYQADEEIVALAADGFHSSQAVYQQELQHLKRWVKEMRLDELEFARVFPMHSLFTSISTTMFPPELSEARIAWSKNTMLTTAVDDLFDVVGTREELENFVTLIDMWDAHEEVGFSSERVEILFRAVYNTNNEIGAKAAAVQKRSVIGHIAELWAEMVRAMMAEAEWRLTGHTPSIDEYMAVGLPSFALGPIIPTSAYLVGPELPDGVARGREFGDLLRLASVCGRLRNDLATYGREKAEGKLNSVLLLAAGGGSVEAARREVEGAIQASRRELLRLAVAGGAVPRPCGALFWDSCKLVHRFYMVEDGYSSPKELMHAGNAVVIDPLRLPAC